MNNAKSQSADQSSETGLITIFLAGDVMTGRGIDQVMPHRSNPILYEPYVDDARAYVELAEEANGPIPKPVSFSYIWGDALDELERLSPDLRIINLETSITTSDDYWRGKGINYRMHPGNIAFLAAAKIDLCVLANNHVLDWGYSGLIDTLDTLKKANVKSVGAGRNREEAEAPAIVEIPEKGRVVVFSFGSPSSGIPLDWAATDDKAGVNLLEDLSSGTVRSIEGQVKAVKQPGDIVLASIHWGGNWGFTIPSEQIEFAHGLIDRAGIDVIYGHSSHHIKGIEVYRGKPVLYGCGDFLDDYEGIRGYEEFRDDLGFMYFPSVDQVTGTLAHFRLTPTRIRNFKVHRASGPDTRWLTDTLNRQGNALGTRVDRGPENNLELRWA